jgi:hypothetical protein
MQSPKAVARQFQSGVVSCGPNMKTAKRDASGKGDRAFECSCLKLYAPVEYFLRYLRRDDIKRIPKGFDGIYRYHYPDTFRNYGNLFARAKKYYGFLNSFA